MALSRAKEAGRRADIQEAKLMYEDGEEFDSDASSYAGACVKVPLFADPLESRNALIRVANRLCAMDVVKLH